MGTWVKISAGWYHARYEAFRIAVEASMNAFILAAALEQGIDMIELSAHERLARAALHRRRRRR